MTHYFSPDPWLAEVLARPAFKMVAPRQGAEGHLSTEMTELARKDSAFFYAKSPTSEVNVSIALSAAGFAVVDTGITLAWAGGGKRPPPGVSVGAARPDQHESAARIAERCFRWSRFHLDPKIPPALANRIKRRWVESYCRGQRGTGLYIAEIGGAIAGFLAVIESQVANRPVAAIDLIGVAPEHQGCGVGTALVRRFIDEWRGRSEELRVGTQAANIQSLRFYERNGFRIVDSTYVLHAHYRDGKPCL